MVPFTKNYFFSSFFGRDIAFPGNVHFQGMCISTECAFPRNVHFHGMSMSTECVHFHPRCFVTPHPHATSQGHPHFIPNDIKKTTTTFFSHRFSWPARGREGAEGCEKGGKKALGEKSEMSVTKVTNSQNVLSSYFSRTLGQNKL